MATIIPVVEDNWILLFWVIPKGFPSSQIFSFLLTSCIRMAIDELQQESCAKYLMGSVEPIAKLSYWENASGTPCRSGVSPTDRRPDSLS